MGRGVPGTGHKAGTRGRDQGAAEAAVAQDAERLVRFKREAQVLAALNHPNIAAIYGLEDAGELQFLVLELVEGEDLAQRLQRGRIPLEDALAIARQIADALAEAHDKGIVHRDLKPANVKQTPEGKVKVLDFGLAKAVGGESSGTGATSTPAILPTVTSAGTAIGVILGTAAYMSPEQARGKPLDRRSDVWAFGCVLYEMLTGLRAFAGGRSPTPWPPSSAASRTGRGCRPIFTLAFDCCSNGAWKRTSGTVTRGSATPKWTFNTSSPIRTAGWQRHASVASPHRLWPWLAVTAVLTAIVVACRPTFHAREHWRSRWEIKPPNVPSGCCRCPTGRPWKFSQPQPRSTMRCSRPTATGLRTRRMRQGDRRSTCGRTRSCRARNEGCRKAVARDRCGRRTARRSTIEATQSLMVTSTPLGPGFVPGRSRSPLLDLSDSGSRETRQPWISFPTATDS